MLLTILGIFGGLSFVSTAVVLGALMLSSQITQDEESGVVHSRIEQNQTQTRSRPIDTTPRQEAAF